GRGLIRHCTVCLGLAKQGRISGVSLVIILGTLLDRFEMSPERILRYLLEIDIDGRVNAKAFVHRAVPSYGGDDLLADIVDCVGLSLRVLPAPDDDLFRSRRGASFAADKAEVAHPIERKVAHLARIGAISPWRQSVWALDQTGERRAFRQRHFTRGLAKIPSRRCFRPVQPAAEIDPVQI